MIKGWRAPGGEIKFARPGAFEDLPITIACGRCWGCRLERSRQWSVRCIHESKSHEQNCFLTLTYSDEALPKDLSLDVEHWQKFAKRLRKKLGKFRFLHCGEYGTEKERPHYHAIIFGMDFTEDRKPHTRTKHGDILYTSETLNKIWGHGYILIGDLTPESAAYVARYNMKKKHGEDAEKHYKGRKPEYITMSRNPGLGANWIKKWKTDVYPSDQVIVDGIVTRPPTFYDNEIAKTDPKLIQKMKAIRAKKNKGKDKDNTTDRLRTREKVSKAKHERKVRTL